MNASELLSGARVVPVVEIDDADSAVRLAETLLESGLAVIEVTLRTPDGLAAIESISNAVPGMLVGAGSVRHAEQIASVVNAGARFAVSPGSSGALLDAAEHAKLPLVPGAVTPSEVLALLGRGYTLQKFFPAELSGGVRYLAAIAAPIPEVSFMPTGGINPDNADAYLALGNVSCLGGSWIAAKRLLAERDFQAIAKLAADASKL